MLDGPESLLAQQFRQVPHVSELQSPAQRRACLAPLTPQAVQTGTPPISDQGREEEVRLQTWPVRAAHTQSCRVPSRGWASGGPGTATELPL